MNSKDTVQVNYYPGYQPSSQRRYKQGICMCITKSRKPNAQSSRPNNERRNADTSGKQGGPSSTFSTRKHQVQKKSAFAKGFERFQLTKNSLESLKKPLGGDKVLERKYRNSQKETAKYLEELQKMDDKQLQLHVKQEMACQAKAAESEADLSPKEQLKQNRKKALMPRGGKLKPKRGDYFRRVRPTQARQQDPLRKLALGQQNISLKDKIDSLLKSDYKTPIAMIYSQLEGKKPLDLPHWHSNIDQIKKAITTYDVALKQLVDIDDTGTLDYEREQIQTLNNNLPQNIANQGKKLSDLLQRVHTGAPQTTIIKGGAVYPGQGEDTGKAKGDFSTLLALAEDYLNQVHCQLENNKEKIENYVEPMIEDFDSVVYVGD
ncbi:hypothetical protein [Microbulbifer sp. JMSA003]|uniref:hypothetical protein n=1 Tax=unclassified Microbulbifer TaxID=2619833 RepID=UPI00403A692F